MLPSERNWVWSSWVLCRPWVNPPDYRFDWNIALTCSAGKSIFCGQKNRSNRSSRSKRSNRFPHCDIYCRSRNAALKADVTEMVDHHRHVLERTQQIRIVQQIFSIHVQPRVPAELAQPPHRALDLRLTLVEGKKADEIESSAAHAGRVQALELLVRNPVIDNADAAVAVAIIQAFQSVQKQAMVAAVDRTMDDDATTEADR